ncbi:MAG TPA: thiamine pyrophosphate-binding protein [Tepidisphaeraceae bacterium]|jgi:hypothetical protein
MDNSRILPVFQILAEDIHALGIRTVFGLMSDDTAVFAVTLDGLGVKFVGARHENNAIAMAEGYAYSTGELGVALIGRGPATANGLHAAVAASRMGSTEKRGPSCQRSATPRRAVKQLPEASPAARNLCRKTEPAHRLNPLAATARRSPSTSSCSRVRSQLR